MFKRVRKKLKATVYAALVYSWFYNLMMLSYIWDRKFKWWLLVFDIKKLYGYTKNSFEIFSEVYYDFVDDFR